MNVKRDGRFGPVCLFLLFALCGLGAPSRAAASQTADLKATFRSGQTFLTWKESGAAQYRIYRSNNKITDLKDLKPLYTVKKGSGTYALENKRKNPQAQFSGKPGYGARFTIVDNPDGDPEKMLPADTGLFVYTAK